MVENISRIVIDTPWKFINELLMYVIKPLVSFYLFVSGVSVKEGAKFYGFPTIFRYRGSKIKIGKNFECRNWWFSNPLGLNHPTILCTWHKGSKIKIGSDVGMSGVSIVASKRIEIGDGTIIGANATIIDTDFHPIKSKSRRYDKRNIRSRPIKIGKNVFIGMNTIVLKGAIIPDDSVVPAGSVVRAGRFRR
jgi:acetyltransferase-like isoleucine patch superfamily enzyme